MFVDLMIIYLFMDIFKKGVHVEQLPEENPQVLPSDDENITQIMPGARGNLVNGLLQFFTPTGLKSKLSTPPIPKNIVRLPTPKEGCGFTNVTNTKIVGGQTAKPGKIAPKYITSTLFFVQFEI